MAKTLLLADYADTALNSETLSIIEDIVAEYGFDMDHVQYAHLSKADQVTKLKGLADIIICMGAETLRVLLPGARPLKDMSGALTWNADLETWVLPTEHPNCIYAPEGKGYGRFDIFYDHLRRAIDICQGTLSLPDPAGQNIQWEFIGHNGTQGYGGDPKVWSGYFECTDEELARQWYLLDCWLFRLEEGEQWFALDTESYTTNHFKPLTMVQIYDPEKDTSYAFNWGVIEQQRELWKRFLRHSNARFVLHNTKHDRKMIWHWLGVDLHDRDDDTMCWALGLTEKGNQTGLKYNSRQYCNAPFYEEGLDEWLDKDNINYGHIRPDVLAEYGCYDVFYTHQLRQILPHLVEREGTQGLVSNILLPAQRTFAEMEYAGIRVDQEYAAQLKEEWAPLVEEAVKNVQDYARDMGFPLDPDVVKNQVVRRICDCVPVSLHRDLESVRWMSLGKTLREVHGVDPACTACNKRRYVREIDDTLNVNSSTQMQHLCFDVLGMDETYEGRKTNKYFWKLNPSHEFTKLRNEYAEMLYLSRNLIEGFGKFVWEDGRVHPDFLLFGTVTGRLAVKNPAVQTIPKHSKNAKAIRRIFLPDEDHVVIDVDYSNLELYMAHHLTGDEALLEALQKDLHRMTASAMYMKDYEEVSDEERQSAKPVNFGCVPISTKILTPQGWKSWDEIEIGELTLGYNPVTGRSEWTPVLKVHYYENAPTIRLKGGFNWNATTTPNHRWYTRNQWGLERFETTEKMSKGSNIVLAAPAHTDGKLDISATEAALLGWLVTDGTLKFIEGDGVTARIYQKKPEYVAKIRSLLDGIDYTEKVKSNDTHWFFLRANWVRDLLSRAELPNADVGEEWVLKLDPEQRYAFLEACFEAEGHERSNGVRVIGQNEGAVQKAIALAAYLEGYFVRDVVENCKGGTAPHHRMRLGKPHITNQRLGRTYADTQDVWCVTTGLGTWTMLHEGQTMLTGNSGYNIGAQKLARDINLINVTGGRREKAQEFLDAFWARYTVWDNARQDWMKEAMETCKLRTETGRVRRWNLITKDNLWKVRNQACNFKGQSMASDLCLTSVIRLQKELTKRRWGRVMITVHDSIVFSIHKLHVHRAVELIREVMTTPVFETRTPFKVDVQVGLNYGDMVAYDATENYMNW